MGVINSELTMQQAFALDKERIRKAFMCQLVCAETEDGLVYEEATAEDCEEFILNVFDNAVEKFIQAYSTNKALEIIAKKNGLNFEDYLDELEKEVNVQYESEMDNSEYMFENNSRFVPLNVQAVS